MAISSVLKKAGHETELVMASGIDKVVEEIVRINPHLVMFSTLTATGDFEWSLEVANSIKRNNGDILTIFGSLHPTLFPDETMSHQAVDMICRGEGEFPMLALCNRLDGRESYSDIPGLWVKSSGGVVKNPLGELIANLDVLPFPDRELYQKYGYFDNLHSIDVIAGRGCLFSCSYCMNTTLKEMSQGKGKFVRKFSPEYIISELEDVKRKFNPRSFTFLDELFTANKGWVREFAQEYKKRIHLPFVCNITVDTIDDESAAYLAEAGVSRICMGIETGNEVMRNNLLNKRFTNGQAEETARLLHKHGIKFLTSNMIGLPGETIDNAFETIELNRKIKADFLYFSVFQPYPHLPITKQLKEEGAIEDVNPADFNTTFFKDSVLKQKNIKQLVNLHKFFLVAVKFPWTKPLIKRLIKLPPNWFFEQVFILSYAWMALACFRRHPLQLMAMGIGNTKIFFEDKRKRKAGPAAGGIQPRPGRLEIDSRAAVS
ncbi:MAG: radical SAM protein, partial [Candidatus Omnitrophota bacterium]|nr:radical SAM protein [Candidatus Omnitrophota bacterium]